MLELEIFVTRPVNVVSGNASIDTSTESPRCTRTTSVSSTRTFAWMTERSEMVSSSPTSLENVPGTATSPSSTADRKSTRLNSSHLVISYAVFCLKKKKKINNKSEQHHHHLTNSHN